MTEICAICGREFIAGEAIHRKRFEHPVDGTLFPVIVWALVHPPCRDEYDADQQRPHMIAEQIYPYARRSYAAA